MTESSEIKKSIEFLTSLLDKDEDAVIECVRKTSLFHKKSFSSVLNIITHDWIRKTLRIWPRCYSCGLPKQNYNFPCRLAHTVFLDYQELKEWCDLKESKQTSPSKYISRTERLRQARKEFEREKKELEHKRRASPRVRFDI